MLYDFVLEHFIVKRPFSLFSFTVYATMVKTYCCYFIRWTALHFDIDLSSSGCSFMIDVNAALKSVHMQAHQVCKVIFPERNCITNVKL
jgi:hypothetical protein